MLSQQNRIGRLTTPMGQDVLCLVELQAREGLSRLFDFDVVAIAEDANLDTEALIGKPCAVEVDAGSAGGRWFHGLVTEGEWNERVEEFSYYRLRLRPWCWLLTKTADCRIHHDKTVVQIIRDTFADHGFSDYKLVLTQSYPTLHYTVQYCEDDWSFVCRLMELHGIYYFFEHAADKHTLVLADAYAAHAAEKPARALQFNASGAQALVAMHKPYVSRWSPRRRLRSGHFEITDYNHLTPTSSQLSTRPNPHNYAHGHFEVFDWPGPHVNREQGDAYVRVLTEAEEAQDGRRTAAGVAASVFPGVLVQLGEHPRAAENGEYLTVEMKSQLGPQEYRSRVTAPDVGFTAEYEFQPSAKPFRAPLETPKPLIHSLQTASVVGMAGGDPTEEIDCDDHGRILVHFFWDRHNDRSCRVRVNQVWGGQTWGAQTIPRIGMEVLVAYIDGDPDRPIVVGTAPNPQTLTVPYALPDLKTKMVLRSKTYKATGFNELTFDDATHAEKIYLHGQKDQDIHIENNRAKRVDNNQSESVGHNKSIEVGNNHHEVIGGNMTLMVGPNILQSFVTNKFQAFTARIPTLANNLGVPSPLTMGEGNLVIGVGKNKAETVMVSSVEIVGAAKATTTGGGYQLTVGGVKNESVAMGTWEEVGQTKVTIVGKKYEIICGKSKITLDREGNITLEGVNLTLKGSQTIALTSPKISNN